MFGDRISGLSLTPRHLHMRYRSPDHFIDLFRTWFGPMKVAFERVGPDGEDALAGDLRDLLERSNTDNDTLVVPSEYLEVVATRA